MYTLVRTKIFIRGFSSVYTHTACSTLWLATDARA